MSSGTRANRLTSGGRCVVCAILLSCASLLTCDAQGSTTLNVPSLDRIDLAWKQLAAGRCRAAYIAFKQAFEERESEGPESVGYIESLKGLMISSILSRRLSDAADAWRAIQHVSGPEPPADQLVFENKILVALQAYRNDTRNNSIVNAGPGPDPVIADGVRRETAGDIRGAIRSWSANAVGGGPNDLTDVQEALIGIAEMQLGDWAAAEKYWIRAARYRRAVPDLATPTSGNMIALSMLYHFRLSIPRGEGRYSVTL